MTKRQEQIIETSIRLIGERGYGHLTMKNIAAALGITEAALYRHFPGKAAILHGVLDAFENSAAGELENSLPGWAGIEAFVRSRFQRVEGQPPLAKIMFSEELFQDDPALAERMLHLMHSHKDSISALLLSAQERNEVRADIAPDILFRLIFGPVRLLIKQWALSGNAFLLRDKGEELLSALRCTLAPPEGRNK